MTKEQFDKMCQELLDRGYKYNKGNAIFEPYYYKNIEYREDKYGKRRAINLLMFKVWDYTRFADRISEISYYSLEPIIQYSREIDERIDVTLSHPKRSIDELEEIAIKFGEWADKNIKHIVE